MWAQGVRSLRAGVVVVYCWENNFCGACTFSFVLCNMIPTKQICTRLRILSATYGPAEGRKLLDGKLVDYNKKETYVPYQRDALPFLRTLKELPCGDEDFVEDQIDFGEDGVDINQGIEFCGDSVEQQTSTNSFTLLEGRPMNAVFGDPCPGTTKQLRVEYVFRDYFYTETKVESNEATTAAQ